MPLRLPSALTRIVPPDNRYRAESRLTDRSAGRRGISVKVIADTANVPASRAKAGAGPAVATRLPPSAGPRSVPAWAIAQYSELPVPNWSASSSEGKIVNEAGMNRPSPAPTRTATGPSQSSDTRCLAASTVSTTTTAHRVTSVASMRVRPPPWPESTSQGKATAYAQSPTAEVNCPAARSLKLRAPSGPDRQPARAGAFWIRVPAPLRFPWLESWSAVTSSPGIRSPRQSAKRASK